MHKCLPVMVIQLIIDVSFLRFLKNFIQCILYLFHNIPLFIFLTFIHEGRDTQRNAELNPFIG